MINFIIKTDDYSLAEEKINNISNSMDNPDIITYDLNEDNIYDVVDEITTVSLFDNPKLVIIKRGDKLLSASLKDIKELEAAMANIENSNVLVIVDEEFDIKKEERFEKYSIIKKYSQMFDLKVKDMSFEDYIKKDLDNSGYLISNDAINMLANISISLTMLKSNLEILKCYCMEDKNITGDMVDLLISKPIDDDIYQISNAVLKHDKKLCFELLKGFREKKVDSNYLIALLLNKFQELYNVNILARNNIRQEDIANIFGVKPGKAYYMLKDSKSQSLESIKMNLEYLSKLDYDIKSGKVNPDLGLELYFLR